ncbi:hypothetical protein, partial [Klebsiella pneumoniae]|uniref:hypothetical protein n=1 Tax=Klebsiella pneumoniae TaxID=573 RepID=UPI0024AF07BC
MYKRDSRGLQKKSMTTPIKKKIIIPKTAPTRKPLAGVGGAAKRQKPNPHPGLMKNRFTAFFFLEPPPPPRVGARPAREKTDFPRPPLAI